MILILLALTRWRQSEANDYLFLFQLNFDTDQEDESEESGSRKLSGTLRTKKVTEFFRQYLFFVAKIWGNIGLLFSVQGRSKVHPRNVQTQSSSSTEDQGFSSVDSFPVNSIESQRLEKEDSWEGSSLPASNSCNSSEGQHTPTNYSDAREPSAKSRESDTSGIDLVSMVVDLLKVQLFHDTCCNRWA